MKSKFLLLIVSVITLTVFGCSGVEIKAPLPAIASQNFFGPDANQITGVWASANRAQGRTPNYVFVERDDNGVFQMAMVSWEENDFETMRYEFVVSTGNDILIMSARAVSVNDLEPEEAYVLCAFTITEGGDIVIWETDISAFEKLVADGVLQGSVSDGFGKLVSLTSAGDEILTIIRSSDDRDLFKFKEPHVMRKISSVFSD
jgi:hypothetical protein